MSEQESNAVEITFEPKQEAEPAKAVETEAKPAEVSTEEATPAEEKVDKTFTQAELDEIVQKRVNKLERKLEKQRIEQETRERVLSEVNRREPEPQGKPTPEQFTDYADYLEALADYKAEAKFAELTQKQREAQQRSQYQSEQERINDRKADLVQTGERKYDDFEEVVANSKAEIAEPAYLAILEADNSADILYYLAKNTADAERIAKLPPYAQAKEIGKLEDKLTKPVKLSNAPDPVTPIKGNAAIVKTYENMTVAEFEADARKRGAAWVR